MANNLQNKKQILDTNSLKEKLKLTKVYFKGRVTLGDIIKKIRNISTILLQKGKLDLNN